MLEIHPADEVADISGMHLAVAVERLPITAGAVQMQRETRALLEFFDRDYHKSLRARRRGNGLSLLAKSALASPVDDTSSAPVSSRIVLAL
jgi:hypothetical protein